MIFKDIIEYYKIVSGCGGYYYPSGVWRRSLIGLPFSFTSWFRALQGENCLLHGKHAYLKNLSEKHPVLLYYRAYSLYICGDFQKAFYCASQFCIYAPHHREGKYLLSDILDSMGKKQQAFDVLTEDWLISKHKTWIKLANLVSNVQDFIYFENIYHMSLSKKLIVENDKCILKSFAMGAQRCGKYDKALDIWSKVVNMSGNIYDEKKKIYPIFAKEALHALNAAFDKEGLQLFLISGTLLGLMRIGDFLPHDFDLDTGIFSGFDSHKLRNAIYASGCFTIMAQRSPHCIRVRHVNGTPIDIFIHYRGHNDFWHGGVKVSWHNSPFGLKRVNFKGQEVFIPDNPEKYLEENYGPDWRTPVVNFDSSRDCPNSRVENQFEVYIHNLKSGVLA